MASSTYPPRFSFSSPSPRTDVDDLYLTDHAANLSRESFYFLLRVSGILFRRLVPPRRCVNCTSRYAHVKTIWILCRAELHQCRLFRLLSVNRSVRSFVSVANANFCRFSVRSDRKISGIWGALFYISCYYKI